MKATKEGPIVGIALEKITKGKGNILALINLSYNKPQKDAEIQNLKTENEKLKEEMTGLKIKTGQTEKDIASLNIKLELLEKKLQRIKS